MEATERALGDAGLAWTREAMTETFARLTISGAEECRIDFAADARIRDLDRSSGIVVLSIEELAADKVLALYGRAAARDFQDVAALRGRFSWRELFALATEKDPGFSAERFLDAVAAFGRLDPEEFDMLVADHQRLSEKVGMWPAEITRQQDSPG